MSSTLRRSSSLTGRRNAQPLPRRSADDLSAFEESMSLFRDVIETNGSRNRREEPMEVDIPAPDSSDKDILLVESVDQHVRGNTKAHRTNDFEITDALLNRGKECLVVRRGQAFDLTLNLNRPYDASKDDLRFNFQFGKAPLPTKGTYVTFILSTKDEPKEWGGYIVSNKENSLRVTLVTPPTCLVGKWRLKIEVVKKGDTKETVFRWSQKDPIYVLFNPWNKDDLVYMKEEELLGEYVLNSAGKIYAGSVKRVSSKPWSFGQFKGVVLDCCMYLLDNSELKDYQRGNPISVSRTISAAVNAPDDSGVLVGNWSGNYADGVSPLKWAGSFDILEQFYQNKEPVQYGQCWVFSGVVTTVCRALGIPCRSVTNFASAHDTDGSITIDYHFDVEGNSMEGANNDSVWNFHVWNDVWMARPDLPAGYGGWQAIDATPQETSDGIYCMGPASLEAIKRGEVQMPYDGKFAFSEVNGDKVYWRLQEDWSFKCVSVVHSGVGRYISTKRAFGDATWRELVIGGDPDREDVTHMYKFPDGSPEERAAVRQANIHAIPIKGRDDAYKTGPKDVSFKLIELSEGNTFMGQPIDVVLKIKNESKETRTLNGTLTIASMYYTGVHGKVISKKSLNGAKVEPGQDLDMSFHVEAAEYFDSLVDHCYCKLSCMCIVEETNQTFAEVDDLRLRKPHLTVKAPATGKVGEDFEIEISFENPLHISLSGAELRIEGDGMEKRAPFNLRKEIVQPKQTFVKSFRMTPIKPGEFEIIMYYNCNQIEAITGTHKIKITE